MKISKRTKEIYLNNKGIIHSIITKNLYDNIRQYYDDLFNDVSIRFMEYVERNGWSEDKIKKKKLFQYLSSQYNRYALTYMSKLTIAKRLTLDYVKKLPSVISIDKMMENNLEPGADYQAELDERIDNSRTVKRVKKILARNYYKEADWVDLLLVDKRPEDITQMQFIWRRERIRRIIRRNRDKFKELK